MTASLNAKQTVTVQLGMKCKAFRDAPSQKYTVQVHPDGQVAVWCSRRQAFVFNHDMSIESRMKARRMAASG